MWGSTRSAPPQRLALKLVLKSESESESEPQAGTEAKAEAVAVVETPANTGLRVQAFWPVTANFFLHYSNENRPSE